MDEKDKHIESVVCVGTGEDVHLKEHTAASLEGVVKCGVEVRVVSWRDLAINNYFPGESKGYGCFI
ncbi:MAG: hypothetical protein Q7R96_01365 [Nanoarchaeota archaeon]|nr:hypothetical protein [Nanoarchaeota archaeon]